MASCTWLPRVASRVGRPDRLRFAIACNEAGEYRTANIVFHEALSMPEAAPGAASGMAERTDDHDLPDAPAAADRGPDLKDPQEPNVLPPADSDVLELTLDIVLEALEAAWADGNRCTMPDVQAQLAADDVDIPIEELAKLLAELEHSRELCICSESILWRCIA